MTKVFPAQANREKIKTISAPIDMRRSMAMHYRMRAKDDQEFQVKNGSG